MESNEQLQAKLEELRTHVPLIKRMIAKLSHVVNTNNNPKSQSQLQRLMGLHNFLTGPMTKVPKMEMLQKMEAVLLSIKDKMQKAESLKPGSGSEQKSEKGLSTPGTSQGRFTVAGPAHSQGSPVVQRPSDSSHAAMSGNSSVPKQATFKHETVSSQKSLYGHGSGLGHATAPGHSSGPGHGASNRVSSNTKNFQSSSKTSKPWIGDRQPSKETTDGESDVVILEKKDMPGKLGDGKRYSENRRELEKPKLTDPRSYLERSKSDVSDPRKRNPSENDRSRDSGNSFSNRDREKSHESFRNVRPPENEQSHKVRHQGYSEISKHDEGGHSSKRNSLLDLPMPPSAPSQANKELFDSSREKLQRIFGIGSDSSKPSKTDDRSSGSVKESRVEHRSSWRDDVKARGIIRKDNNNSTPEIVEERQKEAQFNKHRSHSLEETSGRSFLPSAMKKTHTQNSSGYVDHERSKRVGSSFTSSPQPSHFTGNRGPPPPQPPLDSPMSPPSSPTDTPQSPDQEACFSPVLDSEEATPVKTIPLQNLQEKGVDLEAIKKALAQIQSNEKSKSGTGPGPSYRYEDFVGPAAAAKDDEPYDPEEVWKTVDSESTSRHHPPSSNSASAAVMSGNRDVDLRQIPQVFPHRSHGSHHGARDIDARVPNISQIPLPQRQSSMTSQSSAPQVGIRSSVWDQDHRAQRPVDPRISRGNSGDVDMRCQQFRPHQSSVQQQHSYHAVSSSSHSRSPSLPSTHPPLPRQPPLPKAHPPPPPLPAMPPPPLPESPKPPQPPLPPLPKSPPPKMAENIDRVNKKDTPSRLDHIRSKIAQGAGEFIRPGQRGVAMSQMEKYKLKRQTSSEIKSPPHSATANKDFSSKRAESILPSQSPVSLLDTLLPEDKSECADTGSQISRDPRKQQQDSQPLVRDPRLMPSDSLSLKDTESRARDPRLSSSMGTTSQAVRGPRQDLVKYSGAPKEKRPDASMASTNEGLSRENRDPRKSTGPSESRIRDPRKEIGQLSRHEHSALGRDPRDPREIRDPRQDHSPLTRDPRQDFGGSNRDLWQEHGKFASTSIPLGREARPDIGPYGSMVGMRDPRREPGPYSNILGPQHRDPRFVPRNDRPGNAWSSGSQNMPSGYHPPVPLAHTPSSGMPMPHAQSSGVPMSWDVGENNPAHSASGSLIGQSFTCLMMCGLPHFVNSHHIYRFFEEYILRDISIELDNNYNCKGSAYVHFPSHASAREALEKMNGYLLHGSPIALKICTVGILRQAKNTYEQLNRDREARLGLPERPRGNANPFYKPRPKEPPPHVPTPPAPKPNLIQKPEAEKKELLHDEKTIPKAKEDKDTVKSGSYSSLCGVKVGSLAGSKSFKIPKIKKDEPKTLKVPEESSVKPRDKKSGDKTVAPKTSKEVKKSEKKSSKPPESDSSDSDTPTDRTKQVRRGKKMIIESDSESEVEVKPKSHGSDKKDIYSSEDSDSDDEAMVIDESIHSDDDDDDDEEDTLSEMSSVVSDEPSEQCLPDKCKGVKKKQQQLLPKKGRGRGAPKKVKEAKKAFKPAKPKKERIKKSSPKKPKRKKVLAKVSSEIFIDDLDLQSGVGIKLTRHTQGELEELIPLQNKLKVTIPVPQKFIITLFEDDKGKKRGVKRRVAETLPVQEDAKDTPTEIKIEKSEEDVLLKEIEITGKKTGVKKKVDTRRKAVVKKKIESNESKLKTKPPGSSRGIIPLVLEEQRNDLKYWTPTIRRGKKRKCFSSVNFQRNWKKAKRTMSKLSLKLWSAAVLKQCSESSQDIDENPDKSSEAKRRLSSPVRSSCAKKQRIESEAINNEHSHEDDNSKVSESDLDLFDNTMADEIPDLTLLTPSLLEVEPTICNALPNASVLANVLSPPHGLHQSNDNSVSSVAELVEESAASRLAVDSKVSKESDNNDTLEVGNKEKKLVGNKQTGEFDGKMSFEKETEEEILTKTVSQLVESLDKSLTDDPQSKEVTKDVLGNKNTKSEKEPLDILKRSESEAGGESLEQSKSDMSEIDAETKNDNESKSSEEMVSGEDCDNATQAFQYNTIEEKSKDVSVPKICDSATEVLKCRGNKIEFEKEEKDANSKKNEENLLTNATKQELELSEKVDQTSQHDEMDKERRESLNSQRENKAVEDLKPQGSCTAEPTDQILKKKKEEDGEQSKPSNLKALDMPVLANKEACGELVSSSCNLMNKDKESSTVACSCSTSPNYEKPCNLPKSCCRFPNKEGGDVEMKNLNAFQCTITSVAPQKLDDTKVQSVVKGLPETDYNLKDDNAVVKGDHDKGIHTEVDSLKKGCELVLDSKQDNVEVCGSDYSKADFEGDDDGDDTASIGRMSSSSFMDDASQVSSEGRELKTPDSVVSKKGKRAKVGTPVIPPECRRVTRGSLVEPRVAEVTEWDDGGVIDLFQCDMCDYVGRHIANHLVNFHIERELPCEFKKEDFGPVIREHVGPPVKVQFSDGEPTPALSLTWIPNAMTFEESITCRNCDYFSNSRFDLIYHYLEHVPKAAENAFHCRLCNYMSEVKEEFYNHVSSHTGEYRYVCDLCGYKTYKRSLLEEHHKSNHMTQSRKFSVLNMIQEDGWLYIHVCKICMFVRISLQAAEQHVQQRHGGKADIHKANMSRSIVLHSEIRKSTEGESVVVPRSRYKGKKKKKGKKGPDLEVFVGEDKREEEEEAEAKAKQLVDRISHNIHISTSAQQVHKRMSLLETICQKLDETDVDESGSSVAGSTVPDKGDILKRNTDLGDKVKVNKGNDTCGKVENFGEKISIAKEACESISELPDQKEDVVIPGGDKQKITSGPENSKEETKESESALFPVIEEQKNLSNKKPPISEENSVESDSDSTVSALDASTFDEDHIIVGSGSLQDTIRKLSAQLDKDSKEKAEKDKVEKEKQDIKKATEQSEKHDETDLHEDDSDSDTLVICEDVDTDTKEVAASPQAAKSSTDEEPAFIDDGSSLQNSIQSILRESAESTADSKMPKLRIRPASQLLDPSHLLDPRFRIVPKSRMQTSSRRQKQPSFHFGDRQSSFVSLQQGRMLVSTNFVCGVPECEYSSDVHSFVLKHIITMHGAFKCINSGCHFVTKSRSLYSAHMQQNHPNMNFLVCPFLCKVTISNFNQLLDHLGEHQNSETHELSSVSEVEDDGTGELGFLRIESVGTLDPASASRMFGEDFRNSSPSVSSSQLESPVKFTTAVTKSTGDVLSSSCFRVASESAQSNAMSLATGQPSSSASTTTTEGRSQITSQSGTSESGNSNFQGGKSFLLCSLQDSALKSKQESGVTSNTYTGVSGKPVSLEIQSSLGGMTPLADPHPTTQTDSSKGLESHDTTTDLDLPKTTTSVSTLNADSSGLRGDLTSKLNPNVVTVEDDDQVEDRSVKRSPPPGLATLPKHPPTVPIQEVFVEYQPADIFRTLTTKLAPEVFKCMYPGCVYADDEPDSFKSHISLHGRGYRCCYCLMLMSDPDSLIDHVLTEHSNCEYQCKYCLYRAYTKIYMGVHLKNFHPYDEPRYIKVGTIRSGYPPSPPIDQFVRPYRCSYEGCQYRTVDSEAFRIHVQQTHGPFVILSCNYCHKHLHVIPLIDHMREHQMHAHQCPYCLHGDAERERLLGHLLNCHSGRRGKVLVRKHNEEESSEGASKIEERSSPVHQPSQVPAPPKPLSERKVTLNFDETPPRKTSEGGSSSSATPSPAKEINQSRLEGRRVSRSLSRELGDSDSSTSKATNSISEDSSGQPAEKTGLSGHALYRCGNDGCKYTSLTQVELREHLQVCDLTLDSTTKCYHCGKQCRHLSTLFDHLRVHGPKRYCCGVTGCDYRATMAHYFKNHMKQIHHCSGFKHLIKDPKNKDPETQEFVVYPKDAVLPIRVAKRRKYVYSYEDIPRIPKPHVSYQDLKCYHCQFSTKVRLNLIKHLRLHEKYPDGIPEKLYISGSLSSPIPSKQPINPVPCLERKELMFDKMMNLAGSSFENKKQKEDNLRIKNPIPSDELEKLPKHVPEERLHSCGVENCNYVSCDDMMLKYHIRSLHADMTTFPCPHCIDLTITVEKMTAHFKLHGDRLYRCGWCPYISARRNIVERHMKEKHHGKKPFDFVIREPQDPDASKKVEDQPAEQQDTSGLTPAPPPPPPPPPPLPADPPQWQCGLCKFSSVTQQDMVNHTSFKHSIKSQYKCGYCSVRSSVRASFDAHFAAKHPSQPFRVLCMYYRLDSEDIEPLKHGDGQNTHEPIWRRNDPERIRHIRGIMLDDPEVKKTWLKNTATGSPSKGEYVCPVCGSFKTSCVSTFRSHLCREADYDRYQCVECGVSNALLPNLQRHYTKTHHSSFTSDSYLNLPVEDDKEAWVEGVISHQEKLIKLWQDKGGSDQDSHQTPTKSPVATRLSSAQELSSHTGEGSPQQGGVVLHDSGSERGRFVCEVCGCECRTAAGLKSHTTAMHQTRFKCHYCPFASNSEDAVKQHCSLKHPKLQNEVLDVSQRTRLQKEEHLLTESGGPTSASSQEASEAEGSEAGKSCNEGTEKPDSVKIYSCQYCPFSTNIQSSLNTHNRKKHVDTRMYRCNHCNSRFATNNDTMRHHRWKHQQLKPDITYLDQAEGISVPEQSDEENCGTVFSTPVSDSSSKKSHRHIPGQDLPKKNRNRTPVHSRASSPVPRTESANLPSVENLPVAPILKSTVESHVVYSCCHCSHRSSKEVMDDHMKKHHRDMPYQVRREEADKVFTEVYIYKCIHCIVESISHAQSMDHWIQNHALRDFKYQMVLRHSGEVSNQVVTSTTTDKDLSEPSVVDPDKFLNDDTGLSTSGSDFGAEVTSSMVSTSSLEGVSTSVGNPLSIVKRRGSGLDIVSPHRYSFDTEEEDQSEMGDSIDEDGDSTIQSSSDIESQDMMYKCGYCKKSSSRLQEMEAHMTKIHADKPKTVRKLKRDVYDQLYQAEFECGYCGEKGRNSDMTKHQRLSHPNLPHKFTRVPPAPRENTCYRCEVCAHVVKNMSSIRLHLRRRHPEASEFTFTKLTFDSPMRFPIKQPYKCNYCGDVGETFQEMQTHHAFLHSHLEISIKNLRDEALSSVHTPSTSSCTEEVPVVGNVSFPVATSSTLPTLSPSYSKKPMNDTVPRLKNTARKSFPVSVSRTVAMKSTAKPQSSVLSSSTGQDCCDSLDSTDSSQQLIYACVDLGAGVPVKLTVQKLGKLINLQPCVVLERLNSFRSASDL